MIIIGNVVLQNLELKEDALAALNLPIDVQKGMRMKTYSLHHSIIFYNNMSSLQSNTSAA